MEKDLFKRRADEAKEKNSEYKNAKTIIDGIANLPEAPLDRRWIWELIQNAKDAANGSVEIKIVLTKESLLFSHNAGPFSVDDLVGLIDQSSDKARAKVGEKPETTGKFGTGFMSTHNLSKIVEVSGVLEAADDAGKIISKRFERLVLDRRSVDPDEMRKKIAEANNVFLLEHNLHDAELLQECITSFRYSFDENNKKGYELAAQGIADLRLSLPYVFAFVSQLDSISVDLENERYVYRREQTREVESRLALVKIRRAGLSAKSNGVEVEVEDFRVIACFSNVSDTVMIAFEVEWVEDDYYQVVRRPGKPRVFCDFPLVGSENFPFPVVINSPLFMVKESRSEIGLGAGDHEYVVQNKKIIEEAVLLYERLIDTVTSGDLWGDIHLLGFMDEKPLNNIDQEWFNAHVAKKIVGKFVEARMVEINDGELTCLGDVSILVDHGAYLDEFTRLVSGMEYIFKGRIFPLAKHAKVWDTISKNGFFKLSGKTLKQYSVKDLLAEIFAKKSISSLAVECFGGHKENTSAWLGRVLDFTKKRVASGDQSIYPSYREYRSLPIFPNQEGDFKRYEELHIDEVAEELKCVFEGLGGKIRDRLLDPAFNNICPSTIKKYTSKSIFDDINSYLYPS